MGKNNNFSTWESIDWQIVTSRVLQLQRRIYKAQTSNSKKHRIHGLQQLLINSLDAKLLAVRAVTTLDKGRKTLTDKNLTNLKQTFGSGARSGFVSVFVTPMLGVDKQVILLDDEKMALAKKLSLDGKSSPIKRVWIHKPFACPDISVTFLKKMSFPNLPSYTLKGVRGSGNNVKRGRSKHQTEKRPLSIPTIQDRAKQALAKLALEPEWEAVFEPNSYGFRPGRSAHDAIEAIFNSLLFNRPKWIFDADIIKGFDRINHSHFLKKLNTFPQMENQISSWLRAGIFEEYANIPKREIYSMGTYQRGIISPLLSNIALHGLEEYLKEYVSNLSLKSFSTIYSGRRAKANSLTIVRYADHFVIIHFQREILDLCVTETRKWLSKTGLEISEEKSSVRDCRESFNFLGFNTTLVKKQGRYKVKIVPSRESQLRYLENVRTIIKNNRSVSTYELISKLRPVVIGWGNYYRFCECTDIFTKQSNLLFQMIRHWVFRRHPQEGRTAVKERYWPSGQTFYFHGSKHQDNWTLCGQTLKKGFLVENFLPHMSWIHSQKFVKIQTTKSPFDSDHAYWALRNSKYSAYPLQISKLYKVQGGICPLCNNYFDTFSKLEVDHIVPKALGGKGVYSNLQLLHKDCHLKKTAADMVSIAEARRYKS